MVLHKTNSHPLLLVERVRVGAAQAHIILALTINWLVPRDPHPGPSHKRGGRRISIHFKLFGR